MAISLMKEEEQHILKVLPILLKKDMRSAREETNKRFAEMRVEIAEEFECQKDWVGTAGSKEGQGETWKIPLLGL